MYVANCGCLYNYIPKVANRDKFGTKIIPCYICCQKDSKKGRDFSDTLAGLETIIIIIAH